MTEFALRRLFEAFTRLLLSVVLILAAVEIAILCARWQGGEETRHVYGEVLEWFTGDVPIDLSPIVSGEPVSWWLATVTGFLASLKALGLAVLLSLAIGPPLGILAARFRRLRWVEPCVSPLFLAAYWPGFWLACLMIWWLVEKWNQPAFADATVMAGGGMESWWRVFLVAGIIAPGAIAWQIRSISRGIRKAGNADHVWGALSRGQAGSRLYYRHVFASALDPVTRCLDRVLPVMVGGQLFVEWAFQYPGLGHLMIESAKNGLYAGLLSGGIAVSLLIVLCRLAGEVLYGAVDRRGRESMPGEVV